MKRTKSDTRSIESSHTALPELPLSEIRQRLLKWYARGRRDLPWRLDQDPYKVWVSEIMLQQTRAEVVAPYFERFIARFPTLGALAEAREAEVLSAWSGLGYYSRGRRLHATARAVVARHGGAFPALPAEVRALPGVGPYTAGAILSIAFGQREPAIDGNVRRVLARLAALEQDLSRRPGEEAVRGLAERLVPPQAPGDFNQALMELGATVCTPRSPRCPICPLRSLCRALALGRPADFPRELGRTKKEEWIHVAALFRDPSGRVLLVQRPADARLLPGLWHLPGLFLPQAEASQAVRTLERELRSLLGRRIRLGQAVAETTHQITFRRIRAVAYGGDASSVPDPLQHGVWTSDPRSDGLPTSSLLQKLLAGLGAPRQLGLPAIGPAPSQPD
jgi:A/G-specific adenine glycosylase